MTKTPEEKRTPRKHLRRIGSLAAKKIGRGIRRIPMSVLPWFLVGVIRMGKYQGLDSEI